MIFQTLRQNIEANILWTCVLKWGVFYFLISKSKKFNPSKCTILIIAISAYNIKFWSYNKILDVPNPPSKPYTTETTLFTIILSWTAPDNDGGSPVKGYKIEMCNAEEETWETLSENCSVCIN